MSRKTSKTRKKSITLSPPLTENDVHDIAEHFNGANCPMGHTDGLSIDDNGYQEGPHRVYLEFPSKAINTDIDSFDYSIPMYEPFTKVNRGNVDDDHLAASLLKLPPEYHAFRDQVWQGFGLPPENERHHQIIAKEKKKCAENYQRVQKLREEIPLPVNNRVLPVSFRNTATIRQHAYQTLQPDDNCNTLVTTGVVPCIVVIFHNPNTNAISLGHIDSWMAVDQLNTMRKEVQSRPGQKINVILWGGKKDHSEELAGHILDVIERHPEMTLVAADVCNPSRYGIDAIAVSRTGVMRMESSHVMESMTSRRAAGIEKLFQDIFCKNIKPGSPHLKKGDIGRSRGKSTSDTGE